MTQYEIDSAIFDGSENALYFTCAMVDDMAANNQPRASQRAIDASIQWAMVDVLKFYDTVGSDSELTDNDLNNAIDNIHEYDFAKLLDINDFTYQVGTDADALGGGGSVIIVNGDGSTILPSARSYQFTVASNGQTSFVMPFNASLIDVDSVSVTLNSVLDPTINIDFTLSGTAFTWISDFYLSAGMVFEIKYSA